MYRVSPSLPVEPGGEYGGGALILVCIDELNYFMDIAALDWKQVYIFSPSQLLLLFPYPLPTTIDLILIIAMLGSFGNLVRALRPIRLPSRIDISNVSPLLSSI